MRNDSCTKQFKNTRNYIDYSKILLATIVGLLNSFFYDNYLIMVILCAIEILFLVRCFVKKDDLTYICCYMVFLSFSMESKIFTGTEMFYGFKNFKIAGINLAVWMFIPFIILSLSNYSNYLKYANTLHKVIVRKLAFFTFLASIIGILLFLLDDNGIQTHNESLIILLNSYYTYWLPFIQILFISITIIKNRTKLVEAEKYLFASIVALTLVSIFCIVFKNFGNRGGFSALQISEIYFLLICTIPLITYDRFDPKSKVVLGICGIVILYVSLIYNASGKNVLIALFIPLLMLILEIQRKNKLKVILGVLLATVSLFFFVNILLPYFMNESIFLTLKVNQAMSIFSAGGVNWLANMPGSPKMRIYEFMNIVSEYVEKPWFLLTGKGFCGSIKDNLNLFGDASEFTFSVWELHTQIYMSMHESINNFFLIGGLSGLYVIISICVNLSFKLYKSPWLIFGLIWVLFFYGYHLNVSIYGILSLIVGLADISNESCDKTH